MAMALMPKPSLEDLAVKICKLVEENASSILGCIPPNFKFNDEDGKPAIRGMDIPKAVEIILGLNKGGDHLVTDVLRAQLDNPHRSGVTFWLPRNKNVSKMRKDFLALGKEIEDFEIPDNMRRFKYNRDGLFKNDDSDGDSDSDSDGDDRDPYRSIDDDFP